MVIDPRDRESDARVLRALALLIPSLGLITEFIGKQVPGHV